MCPACGGYDVSMFEFDCGGAEYRDAGEAFRCFQCGTVGDLADLAEDPWSDCPAPEDFWYELPPSDAEVEPIPPQSEDSDVPEWGEEVA